MKRILLTGLSVAAFFAASAQTAVTETQTDATTNFAYLGVNFAQDDFADGRSYGLESGGVFWWPDVSEEKVLEGETIPFYTAKRDSVANGMQFTVTNKVKKYEPVGVGFGGSEAEPVYIDLSGDATLIVEVENKSTETVRFRAALQDIYKNLIDTEDAIVNDATPWNGAIFIDIEANETATLTITDAVAKAGGEAKYPAEGSPLIETDFDFTKVKGVNFTVISTDQETEGIEGAVVVIRNFKLGATPVGVGFSNNVEKLSTTLYPNPATSTLNFSEELQNVTIFNSKGTQVFSAAKANSVNVAEFTNGIYFLQTEKGSKSFIVE